MKRQVFPIIGTINTKRSRAAFVRTNFFVIIEGHASATLYNLMGHFRALRGLCIKTRLSTQLLISK